MYTAASILLWVPHPHRAHSVMWITSPPIPVKFTHLPEGTQHHKLCRNVCTTSHLYETKLIQEANLLLITVNHRPST